MTFHQWMIEVDKYLVKAIGLTHRDLPDQPYRDQFEDGLDPFEAVQQVLEEEGLEVGDD